MKKIFLSIFMIFALLFAGCVDLTEHPMSVLTPGGYYTSKQGIETLVYSIYSKMRFLGGGTHFYRLTQMGTDVCQAGLSSHPNLEDNYQMAPTDGPCTSFWTDAYTVINACNYVTDYLPQVEDMTDAEKKGREAEARFFRAWMYYHLTMQFGDVHYSTEATLDVETEANRTPVNTIWDESIYPDLEFAVANLPAKQADYGRIDQWSAKFFLAYVLLSDIRATSTHFSRAAQLTTDIINNSHYELQPTRALVFDENNEHNSEIMWSIQFPQDELYLQGGNYSHLIYVTSYQECPGMTRVVQYGRSYIQFKPVPAYFDLYDETIDSRYEAWWLDTWLCTLPGTYTIKSGDVTRTVTYEYMVDTTIVMPKRAWSKEYIDSKPYRVFNPELEPNYGANYYNQDLRYYPTLKKFMDGKRTTANEARGNREWVVFRLAEAYLLAGEAYFRMGQADEAAKWINVIRRNAAYPGKEDAMTITAADLSIDFILDERSRELFGEDNRWEDLKRLGKLPERALLNPNVTEWKDYYMLRPIPQSHIDRCTNDYPQNPGW
ncbi:MAG: RagB/SusD family nutrient uptake outer membrane protein [Tannerella sp.]|jgi:tetratricopeptide (TPR) repeat protein|nr:RagB/SusD family nutrient uptake outer membrane protein [Tannerella sp.]